MSGYAILSDRTVVGVERGAVVVPPAPPFSHVVLGDDPQGWPSVGDVWVGGALFVKPTPVPPEVPVFDLIISEVVVTGVPAEKVLRRGSGDIRAPKGATLTPKGRVEKDGVVVATFSDYFTLPVEKRGGSPIPLFVFFDCGVIVNTSWTPGAPGFYEVTEVSINSELTDFKLRFSGLRVIISEG